MGEYRGRCCICQKPQQLLDEEDEPILCCDCNNPVNRETYNKLLANKKQVGDKDEQRYKNLLNLSKRYKKR